MTGWHRLAIATAMTVSALLAAPPEVLAQGGAALLAKPLDEQARANPLQGLPQGAQNMAQNFAEGGGAPPAAAPAADQGAEPDTSIFSVKYIPAYFLTVLGAGLGLFSACKFSGRRRDV